MICRIEVLDLTAKVNPEMGGIKPLNRGNPGDTGGGVTPCFLDGVAYGTHHAKAGHDNTPLLKEFIRLLKTSTAR